MVNQPFTRREFLGTTVAAGAGLLLTSCRPESASSPAAVQGSVLNKINVALIGCGAQGQVLLDSLMVIEGIRLVAIVDIWSYNRDSNIRRLKSQGVEVRGYERICSRMKRICRRLSWPPRISGTRRSPMPV